MREIVDWRITKRTKLLEINNDMCHNYYYLINGRINNADRSAYKKFKFVIWFDIFDVDEFFNHVEDDVWLERPITDDDISAYIDECICCYTDMIYSYENCNDFYEMCNNSIIRYNEIARYW
jgi:hypothetical protein